MINQHITEETEVDKDFKVVIINPKSCLLLHSEAKVLFLKHLFASTFEHDSLSSTDINIQNRQD